MRAWSEIRSTIRAQIRALERAGVRSLVKKVLAGTGALLLKLSVALVVGAITLALVPLLPAKLQSSAVALLRKAGLPEMLTPADPYSVKYRVTLDPNYGVGIVNDLFRFGAESKSSPILYDAIGLPNVLICRPWEYAAANLNEVLLYFLRVHPRCFSLSKRDPNGYVLTKNPDAMQTILRGDGSIRAVACECQNEAAVKKTLDQAGLQ